MLWFAFILLSLSYWKQPHGCCRAVEMGCDLLSFYYLCRTGNNAIINLCILFSLWFAFILLSLSYWKQPPVINPRASLGCDLLSFYYLCRTGNNTAIATANNSYVVICFHFTIFVVLETTAVDFRDDRKRLWFAFILLSLSYWKQLSIDGAQVYSCCDLLSFYYLCRTGNNVSRQKLIVTDVVICFHFTIFVVLETTHRQVPAHPPPLWFAFILLSLSYWKQHRQVPAHPSPGCDLLSFYYLCRTGNNLMEVYPSYVPVVICFHFTIFVVLETTAIAEKLVGGSCDLLSFYYLCRTGNNTNGKDMCE